MKLYTYNKKKELESKYIEKFIKIDNIKKYIIIYNNNININKQIIDSYKEKPDLLIIKFKNIIEENITELPKFPIFIDDVFYITPICIQQINGFDNSINDKQLLIINLIERIFQMIIHKY
jgi:hypothetical protein